MERTFIAVKPDGVQRGLIAPIIQRFEQRGYKLVALKALIPSTNLLHEHYAEHKGKSFFEGLCKFMQSGPVVAMVWQGHDVIKQARKMMGATDPCKADNGTIRGDLSVSSQMNLVHGSDSEESAKREITLWFKTEEILEWSPALQQHVF